LIFFSARMPRITQKVPEPSVDAAVDVNSIGWGQSAVSSQREWYRVRSCKSVVIPGHIVGDQDVLDVLRWAFWRFCCLLEVVGDRSCRWSLSVSVTTPLILVIFPASLRVTTFGCTITVHFGRVPRFSRFIMRLPDDQVPYVNTSEECPGRINSHTNTDVAQFLLRQG
jgi:hypothetical protein